MTDEKQKNQSHALNKTAIYKIVASLLLSLFFVVFIWGFFDRGVYALGLNIFVFLAVIFGLFIRMIYRNKNLGRRDLFWIIPLGLLPLSYFLYNNPFIKGVNLLVFPVLTAMFVNYAGLKDKNSRRWDFVFVSRMIGRILSFFTQIGSAINAYASLLLPKNKQGKGVMRKVVLGLFLFLVIALTVVIPLLSSADAVFAGKMGFIYDWLNGIISQVMLAKIIVFIVLAVGLLSAIFAWLKDFDYPENGDSSKPVDSIVSGIVMGGMLGIYLLFLWVQIERLWVGSLPFEFAATESLVKSGFWQLFFLTGLNVLIYFFTYRKTSPLVQKILTAFIAASLLLLISAGYRMALYVVFYGLSYEKFFASYTVLYSAILFIWLISRQFIARRADIFKFLVFLFLWMFAAVSILPIEFFIFKTNLALSQRPDSRINLYELTMLSPDALSLVKTNQSELISRIYDHETGKYAIEAADFSSWIEKQEKRIQAKPWYEKSLTDLTYSGDQF